MIYGCKIIVYKNPLISKKRESNKTDAAADYIMLARLLTKVPQKKTLSN